MNISQAILGVQPSHEGLIIDPCVPADFGDFKLTRKFRGAIYYISIKKAPGVQKGVSRMLVDGVETEGNLVRPIPGKTEYHVTVFME